MPFTYGPRSINPLLELTHFPGGAGDSWRPTRVAYATWRAICFCAMSAASCRNACSTFCPVRADVK